MKYGLIESALAIYDPVFRIAFGEIYSRRAFPRIHSYEGESPDSRIWAVRQDEKALTPLVRDLLEGDIPDRVFWGRYGLDRDECAQRLDTVVKEHKEVLSLLDILNKSGSFFFVEYDPETADILLKRGMIPLGYGSTISVKSGSIVMRIDNRRYSWGVDIRGTKGDKTPFEQRLTERVMSLLLDGQKEEALVEVETALARLNGDEVDLDELVYPFVTKKDWYAISYPARNRRRVQVIQENRMMKGETKPSGYVVIDGKVVAVDGETFRSGQYPVAKSDYRDKLKDSLVGQMVNAVYGNRVRKQVFNQTGQLVLIG